MEKKPAISDETRRAILEAAWSRAIEGESLDLPLADIARAVGVSRQTLYLAFGSRTGLLVAMLDEKDARSPELQRMIAIRESDTLAPEHLWIYLDLWLDYLPQIFPVATKLESQSASDAEIARAYSTRLHDRLRLTLRRLMQSPEQAGLLHPNISAEDAGDMAWSLVHPATWRLLVIEAGWSPEAFRTRQMDTVRRAIFAGP